MLLAAVVTSLLVHQVPDSAAALAARVEIVRTEYGVPHILADDLKAMGFALGYVQSEDYGASIATGLIESRGTYARYVGIEAVESDLVARGIHARAVETFHRLDASTRDVYAGFAEGVNHYVRLHADEFPTWIGPNFDAIDAHARDVQTWSRGDAAGFVRRISARAGGRVPESPSPEETRDAVAFALDGSNAWAFDGSRTTSGKAILLRNPHLDWGTDLPLLERLSGSSYYEAHVRVPGVLDFYGDFRIGTAFGIIGGFNGRLGWATTNNYPTYSQVYALEAHPTLDNHAVLDGSPLPLEGRTTTVDYLTEDGSQALVTRSTWWTPFGPVIHRDGRRIYVLKDPREGEFRRGEQFLRMMQAQSLNAWLDVMRLRAHPSSNFTYADADGNIAHYYNARLPLLPHGATGDTAAFARGSGDIWSELVPWESLPLYVNPPGGYVQQTNDTPDYTNLNVRLDRDTVAANLPEPRLRLRGQLSLQLAGSDAVMSLEDVVELKHTPRMLLAERVLDDLIAIVMESGPTDRVGEALDVLRAWDLGAAADSRGGVLFKFWAERYMSVVDEDEAFRVGWDRTRPTETPFGIGRPTQALGALSFAIERMDSMHFLLDVPWGDVHRLVRGDVDVPVSGCEPTLGCFRALSYLPTGDGRFSASRGDAWVLAVEFGERPRAYSVLSYGQTPRVTSPHYDDQAALFAAGRLKPVAWTDEEIARSRIDQYRPGQEQHR